MDLIVEWFRINLDVVFFFYGVAFVLMGVIIFVNLRSKSRFRLVDIIWALGAFGVTHGINELLDMWIIIKGPSLMMSIFSYFFLIISFIFLFEFGRCFFNLTRKQQKQNPLLSGIWICPVILAIVFLLSFGSGDLLKAGARWARYLLAFPGAVLVGLGFLSYYTEDLKVPVRLRKYFQIAGVTFLIYGILGGLVVPKADFFPANWLNNDSFLEFVHIPVQAFRCLCAMIVTWAVVVSLNIFNWETFEELRNFFDQRGKVAEGIQEGIMLLDKKFKIIWTNKVMVDRYGEVIGEKCYKVTHKRDAPCESPHDVCPLLEAAETKKVASVEHMHFDQSNAEGYFEISVYPLFDKNGQVNEFVHISRNVTERHQKEEELKQAYFELQKAQDELVESEKLAAVGVLASGIAHEIRNPLAIILQSVNFLEDKLKPCPQNIVDVLNLIKNNVVRGNTIIEGIFEFSRKTEATKQNESVVSIIESSLVLVEHEARSGNVEVIKQIQENLPSVMVNRQKIEQVLVNVLLNAIQAMPGGGKIFIRVYLKKFDEIGDKVGRRKSDTFLLGEQALAVEIEDSGTGISQQNAEKLFTPFFTTKGPKLGVGLGLSVARNIMLSHKGMIEIISREGEFTKVIIVFKVEK